MKKKLPIISLFLFLLIACNQNKHEVDLSGQEVELSTKRFDLDLFKKTNDYKALSADLLSKYGDFYLNFTSLIPSLSSPKDAAHPQYLKEFIKHKDIQTLQAAIESEFEDLTAFENELIRCFSYYHYHFPTKEIPEIVFFNSALNVSPIVNDKQLGIGLDMFLGSDFELYDLVGFPGYLSKRMRSDYMVTNSMRGWLISEFPKQKSENLLEDIIWEGKILYGMDAMFPITHDSIKIEYTSDELLWCEAFEANIWAHLIEKELLYSTDMVERMPLLNEGPFTSGFAKESPSRVGKWLGWQIVRSYMDNSSSSLKDLLQNEDANLILRESNYKPRK